MYKQSNISIFVATSLLAHILFLARYQPDSHFSFEEQHELNVNIADKVIRLSILSEYISGSRSDKSSNSHVEIAANTIKPVANDKRLKESVDKAERSRKVVHENEKHSDKVVEDNRKLQTETQLPTIPGHMINAKGERDKFQKIILTMIESQKFYPLLARRRNMQDIVQVSFELLANGEVTGLIVNGRYKILRHAARAAVLNAAPFPVSVKHIRFPFHIKYLMAFKLE